MERSTKATHFLIKNPRFNEILNGSRIFDVQFTKLLESNEINYEVLQILINYFVSFISHFNISDKQIIDKHLEFLNQYNLHLKTFAKSNKYPYQNNINLKKDRVDYDITLLCSTFLSYPRYCIFETLHSKINVQDDQDVLVVGVGSGIELAILNGISKNTFAYDTDIGSFTKKTFPFVHFFEKHFYYEPHKLYDKIILIELIEHLKYPENLLIDSMKSLKPNGRIHFTTAVNIPQFDHLINFKLNDPDLEKCILKHNFEIEFQLNIPHNYQMKIEAYSCYYIIKKQLVSK